MSEDLNKDNREESLPKELETLFKEVFRSFNIAIKNANLYSKDHPLVKEALSDLKSEFDRLFGHKGSFAIGIMPDNITVDGKQLSKDVDTYSWWARYLHQRGIAGLLFSKGLKQEEMTRLLDFLVLDPKEVLQKRQKGRFIKEGEFQHIQVSELDYRDILKAYHIKQPTGKKASEKKIWDSMVSKFSSNPPDKLSQDDLNQIGEIFDDPGELAEFLQDGTIGQDTDNIQKMIASLTNINSALEKQSKEDQSNYKSNLAKAISSMEPEAMSMMLRLDDPGISEGEKGLSEVLSDSFSEEDLSRIITKIIMQEGRITTHLMKLFNRLSPEQEKSKSVGSLVALKLLQEGAVEDSSALVDSIKSVFSLEKDNSFMSEVYRRTVSFLLDSEKAGPKPAKTETIKKYLKSFDQDQIRLRSLAVLIEVLKTEEDPVDYEEITNMFQGAIPFLNQVKEFVLLNLFIKRLKEDSREGRKPPAIKDFAQKRLEAVRTKELMDGLAEQIPVVDVRNREAIKEILLERPDLSVGSFLDIMVKHEDKNLVDMSVDALSNMGESVIPKLNVLIDDSRPEVLREVINVIKRVNSETALGLLKTIMKNPDKTVRQEAVGALGAFRSEGFQKALIEACHDKEESVWRNALRQLYGVNPERASGVAREKLNINNPFGMKNDQIKKVITLCGELKMKDMFDELIKYFEKKSLFFGKLNQELRVEACVALARIDVERSGPLLEKGLKDRNKSVRELCSALLKMRQNTQAGA
jgi:hypothetical protein